MIALAIYLIVGFLLLWLAALLLTVLFYLCLFAAMTLVALGCWLNDQVKKVNWSWK